MKDSTPEDPILAALQEITNGMEDDSSRLVAHYVTIAGVQVYHSDGSTQTSAMMFRPSTQGSYISEGLLHKAFQVLEEEEEAEFLRKDEE